MAAANSPVPDTMISTPQSAHNQPKKKIVNTVFIEQNIEILYINFSVDFRVKSHLFLTQDQTEV